MHRSFLLIMISASAAAHAADPYAPAKSLIAKQCAACHVVPGVPEAAGDIGPSLTGIAKRPVIAGKLPNTPANMTRWIMHPQHVVSGTAMPELGLTQAQAQSITAYLRTLDKP